MNSNHVLSTLFDFDLDIVLTHVIQMAIAFALVLPIGYHRENSSQNIGLRTFPMVSLASCGFVLIAIETLGADGGMGEVMAGVITGIGFIGGGAILKENFKRKRQHRRHVHSGGDLVGRMYWACGGDGAA